MGDQVKVDILTDEELKNLLAQDSSIGFKDISNFQNEEIARINNPGGDKAISLETKAVNIYFPWLKTALRCLDDDFLYTLRTNRNREIINIEEQAKLKNFTVGVAGMSVGSSIAMALVYSGFSRKIKLADNDVLDTSNLNRLRETLYNIGAPKVALTAQHILELDPFAEVHQFNDGITLENIDSFFEDLDLVVDEIDDFKMKVLIRKKAKDLKIPVIMFTSLGDNILIDIERYDTEEEARPFNGLLPDDGQEIIDNPNIDQAAIRRYSVSVVGPQYIPTRALESVAQMGKTLVGRPQLYSTIAIDGGLASFITRQIVLGNDVKSGRYFVKFSDFIGVESDLEESEKRQQILSKIMSGQQ